MTRAALVARIYAGGDADELRAQLTDGTLYLVEHPDDLDLAHLLEQPASSLSALERLELDPVEIEKREVEELKRSV